MMSNITGGGGTSMNVSSAAELGLRALIIEGDHNEEASRARSIVFPICLTGYSVLIVYNDTSYTSFLKDLEQEFQAHNYKVTTCSCPIDASSMLLDNEIYKFDFVLSAFAIRGVGYWDTLEKISRIFGPRLITMSSDDRKIVVKGGTQGSCDYQIKPIDMQGIQNICQSVVRKRSGLKELERSGSSNSCNLHLKSSDDADISKIDKSIELTYKFQIAVARLGVDAVPEKILEMMNAPTLTVEDVASHLKELRFSRDKIKRGCELVKKFEAKRKALNLLPEPSNFPFDKYCTDYGSYWFLPYKEVGNIRLDLSMDNLNLSSSVGFGHQGI